MNLLMRQEWGSSEEKCNQCTLKQIPEHSQHWTPYSFVNSPKSSHLCLYDDCKKNCIINYLVWRCKQALQRKKHFQERITTKTPRVLLNDKVKTPRLKNFKEKWHPLICQSGVRQGVCLCIMHKTIRKSVLDWRQRMNYVLLFWFFLL
jgi:hypothetical protein